MAHDASSESTDVPPPPPPADTPDLDAEGGFDAPAETRDTPDLDAGYEPELTNEQDGYSRPTAAEVFAKYDEGGGQTEHQPEFTHEQDGYTRPTAAEVFEKYGEQETPSGPDDVFGPGADKEYAPLEREEGQLPGDEVGPLFEGSNEREADEVTRAAGEEKPQATDTGDDSTEDPEPDPQDATDVPGDEAGDDSDVPGEDPEPDPEVTPDDTGEQTGDDSDGSDDESDGPPDPPQEREGTDPMKPSIDEVPAEKEPVEDHRPDLTEAEKKADDTLRRLLERGSDVQTTVPETIEPVTPPTGPEVPGPPTPGVPDWFPPTDPPERPRRLDAEPSPVVDNGFELADSIVNNIGQLADGTALGTGSDATGVGLAVAKGAVEFARNFETITDFVVGSARNLVNDLRDKGSDEDRP